ncbi:helix-turn-helix transcriptional regulator [Calidithermus chliarophilus]|uniref:helix-turn-helix transcriptional regulator n=1 Tax=Calidithermus chliarophilus TaxID=52023 RepID=UPI0003FF188B|nr:helix-turn-helix domain-containing protein [Calidithermus chliarophilus]
MDIERMRALGPFGFFVLEALKRLEAQSHNGFITLGGRDIARMIGLGNGTVYQELQKLERLGLLERVQRGRRIWYRLIPQQRAA